MELILLWGPPAGTTTRNTPIDVGNQYTPYMYGVAHDQAKVPNR